MAENGTTRERVVRHLVEHIRRNGLRAGERLPSIRQMAETWGVGPNVVRDAVLYASSLGLVEVQPRYGVFVRSLDPAPPALPDGDSLSRVLAQEGFNLFHVVEARQLIEVELAGEASQRRRVDDLLPLHQALCEMVQASADRPRYLAADERFHLLVAEIAGNGVLARFLRALLALLRPLRATVAQGPDELDRSTREHEEIYRAILDGDKERAIHAMRYHVVRGREVLLRHLASTPGSSRQQADRAALL